MPQKIRELKAALARAGFVMRPGKGSHTVWVHPDLVDEVTISGKDGADAQKYQVKYVRTALNKLRRER